MQTNDSIFYPWGDINTVHEWHHNDTIEATNVEPFPYHKPGVGIGTMKVLGALVLYVVILAIIMTFQK